jgi:ATPase subunit of ABC transporter with duplicated ATPase domains
MASDSRSAATLLLAQPPPQLLLLDEPTNNLDLASARRLAEALDAYRGALIVASHDLPFLESISITRWLYLDRDSGPTEGWADAGRGLPASPDRAIEDRAS